MTAIPSIPRICDDYAITIRRDGSWWHQGAPIERHNLVRLFARQLVREADGSYWLQTPAERGRITVEDLPFRITAWRRDNEDILFESDCGDEVMLSAAHPLRLDPAGDGGMMPAVLLRDDLWARLSRAVYYDLARAAVAENGWLGVYSGGVFHRLGPQAEAA